jgi:GNAT superfamily N-acetyltransferase
MEIRSGTSADKPTLVELQRQASLAGYRHIFPPNEFPYPLGSTRDRWTQLLRDGSADVFVAEMDGEVAGVTVVAGDEIESLFVAPEWWRHHVGTELLEHACCRIADLGHTVARLYVMEANMRARSFYESAGWSIDGRSHVSPFLPHPVLLGYSKVVSQVPGNPGIKEEEA